MIPPKQQKKRYKESCRKWKKTKMTQEYVCLYPSGSCPSKFYGTAKVHKLFQNSTADDLLLPPIISKIGSAT